MTEIDNNSIYSQLGLSRISEGSDTAKDELGQTQFLELMTAQLKYQDPLKPMENGDFLGQMAQFGTVSGINDLNTSVSTMSESFQSNQALQASTLVGRRVMVPADTAFLADGGTVEGAIELDQAASQVVFTVKNSAGQIVHRNELGLQQAGLVNYEWNGKDNGGNSLPSGNYQIAAEMHQGSAISAAATYAVVDVESVTLGVGGQDLTLSVSGLGDIDMGQVRKIL